MKALMEVGKTYYVKWWNKSEALYWESIFECTGVHPILGTKRDREYHYSVKTIQVKDPTSIGKWTRSFASCGGTLLDGDVINNILLLTKPQNKCSVDLPNDWCVA